MILGNIASSVKPSQYIQIKQNAIISNKALFFLHPFALRGQFDHTTVTHFPISPQRAKGLLSNEVYYSSAQHMTSHGALHYHHRRLPRIARKTKRKKKKTRAKRV